MNPNDFPVSKKNIKKAEGIIPCHLIAPSDYHFTGCLEEAKEVQKNRMKPKKLCLT